MEQAIEDAKSLMEQGWKAREDYNFPLAEQLINKAKDIFVKLDDWYNVTECLNHLAYNDKLKSKQILEHGVLLTNQSLEISNSKKTKNGSAIRASVSLLSAQGNYEEALKLARELYKTLEKPSNKADILQHIATFELRSGKIQEAKKSIDEAEKLLQQGWETEKEPSRSIWKVALLLTRGLIFYNMGDIGKAKAAGKEALSIAIKENLKTRISQAEAFLKTVS